MVKEILTGTEDRMKKVIEILRKDLMGLRAGRATPALLDRITIDYYGTPTPINQVANITVSDPKMIVVQPWDRKMIAVIEKAIMKSDLGLTPASDGMVIRLPIPHLTTERRNDLVKQVKKKTEEERVAVRNLRRDANEAIKKAEKDSLISEDEGKKSQAEVQKLTDKYIKELDMVAANKEKEILEV